MKVLNYDKVIKFAKKETPSENYGNIRVHKCNTASQDPKLSIILLDWSCRERFFSLDWLNKQDIPRNEYELIWIELYDRVVPMVLEKSDTVITLGQQGMYHKHVGYNIGLLQARGDIVTICDSDAVFPPDFVLSIFKSFTDRENPDRLRSLVLMHHELRTSFTYPDDLSETKDLKDHKKWEWWPLNPNCGACMTVLKNDANRFGGFDEHKSFRGYLCGPYDLGWRMVNAGIPEIWHDLSTVLWHFAHPDPVGVNRIRPSFKNLLENTYPHVDLHAFTAVEAFSSGRVLPLRQNPEIFKLRMKKRRIGTQFEGKYAIMTGQLGFSRWSVALMRVKLFFDIIWTALQNVILTWLKAIAKRCLSADGFDFVRRFIESGFMTRMSGTGQPILLESRGGWNIIKFQGLFYGIPQHLGPIDFFKKEHLTTLEIVSAEKIKVLREMIDKSLQEQEK